jgi:sulfatase modifying factor 1
MGTSKNQFDSPVRDVDASRPLRARFGVAALVAACVGGGCVHAVSESVEEAGAGGRAAATVGATGGYSAAGAGGAAVGSVASGGGREPQGYCNLAGRSPEVAVICGGTFAMGESGQLVSVDDFELDIAEVTADAYEACIAAGSCTAPDAGGLCNRAGEGKGNHPINCVDWDQAVAFCAWAGKRLPTEFEWEWAARGQAAATLYPWGDDEPGARACWNGTGNDAGENSRASTCPVAAFPSGDAPGGIHDLGGNVWEWTSTPAGPARVTRGGSWDVADPRWLLAASRAETVPAIRYLGLGLRCARDR